MREHIEFLPDGKQIEGCTQLLCAQLNKNNQYSASDIKAYVKEVIERMSSDDLETMKTAIPTYASKIQEKSGHLKIHTVKHNFISGWIVGKLSADRNIS